VKGKVLLKDPARSYFCKIQIAGSTISPMPWNFKTTPAAMGYPLSHGFYGASIVLKFMDARDDVELNDCC
jgi:hypothetical protein